MIAGSTNLCVRAPHARVLRERRAGCSRVLGGILPHRPLLTRPRVVVPLAAEVDVAAAAVQLARQLHRR